MSDVVGRVRFCVADDDHASPTSAVSAVIYDMFEFVIRTRDGHEWPAVHQHRLPEVLTPAGWDCDAIPRSGDYRLRCDDTEISFSGEDVGWQVTVDAPMALDVAMSLVEIVAAQIEQETREPTEWMRIA